MTNIIEPIEKMIEQWSLKRNVTAKTETFEISFFFAKKKK